MKTFFSITLLVSLLLVQRVDAQCVAEDTALDNCLDGAGLSDPENEACDVCVTAAATAASLSGGITCETLASGNSGLCDALGVCPCPAACTGEVEEYALCEFNEESGNTCTTLTCDASGPPPPPTPIASDPPTPTAQTPSTPTAPSSASLECLAQDTALDNCLDVAGLSDPENEACDVCVTAAATAASLSGGITCETLASGNSGLCDALGVCPCPAACTGEVEEYALCEFNEESGNTCTTLTCDASGPPPPPTPIASDPPTPTAQTPSTPTAPSSASLECLAQDTALDNCLDVAGLSDPENEACDVCVTAAATAASLSGGITCETLASGNSGLCDALGVCPCPAACTGEVEAYALCEFNEESGNTCTTLACDASGPPPPPTPIASDPPTPAPPTPTAETDPPTTATPTTITDPPTPLPPADVGTDPPTTSTATHHLVSNILWLASFGLLLLVSGY